ncbi:unnamed protein product [Rhizoctonia solani]|uniref:NACHT domain-containing protein n=1 Tax=Rhizoctonia solani TaxID=456999 RepID=A0A8H3HYA4_9AGAM|nr:unnamed protein product [Rhizoctonia solani]
MDSRKRTETPLEKDDSNSKRTKLKHTMQTMFRGKGSAGTGAEEGTRASSSTPAAVNPTEDGLSDNDHGLHSNLNQPSQPDHATDENIPDPTNFNAHTDNLPINQVGPADRSHISRNPQVHPTQTKGKDLKRLGSDVLKSVANAFGPVKQVAEIFGECVDTYQVAGNVKVEYDQLIARLQGHLDDLAGYLGDDGSQSMTTSMERLCQSIQEELEMIRDKKGHSKGTRPRYLATDEDMDMILACYRRVEGYLERLSLNANLSIWKIAHDQATDYQSDRMFSLIDRLPSVLAARFNSAEGEALRRRECTSGTRVQEIAQVLGWARNGVDETVYWLNGMAGTGKTTIAYSVCTRLESAHMLGASFFCSRLREECRDVKRIIPSIAYQLARFSRPFHHALCNALEKNPDAYGGSLQLQFNALIKGPVLHDRVRNTLPDELIVVIDALDECENKESTRRILEVLMSDSANLPIKFILSSRPEPEIRDRMTERVKSRLVLHELDKGQVQGDIEKYLREELATINPPDAQIAALVARAGILFIYAATAVRYIGYDNFHRNPTARLRTILAGPQGRITTHSTEIDQLYTTILRAALEDEGLEQDDRVDMQHVLYTMVCAREPLTVGALSELLEIYDLDRVRAALRPLWSVLHVVGERELVTTLHASFPDFMFDPARSKAYHCDSDCHNRKLAEHCFSRTQRNRPQFNVCRLKSSYLSDEMVPDIEDLIAKGIPLDLFYACRYWADHVEAGRYALPPVDELKDFLCNRLLLWIEVLNLKKEMRAGTECMKLVVKWCNQLQGEQELMELAHDAQRFVESFALNTISQSTPHIYVSMLTFWPRSGPIAKHYVRFMDGPVHAEGSALGQRKLAHLAKWDFERRIDAMTVSSDGLFLALAVEDGVMIVDFASGIVVLGPLRIQRRGARSLVFSPDGSRIVYASDEYRNIELRGWDIQTGAAVLGPLTLQITRNDYSPYFHLLLSPDSTRIVAAADGRKIHLWDVENGDMLLSLRAKTGTRAVMFSSDSTRIAVGYDDALHIWDAQSGNNILSLRTSPADQIAFSHDDSRIIYASKWGDVVYVRDANNGDLIHQMSSKGYQVCLGYSPDGRYIVGGNTDSIITVWDAQTGKVMIGQLEGHRYKLTSVAFSPDGSYIITGCKGGIVCTWDARQHNFVHAPRPNSTCPMTINCIKFSPDGTQFVSGSEDGTIRIWDSDTGEMAVGPIKAHKDRIVALDFVDGRVASGSYDGAMCVCDALSGQILLGPLEVHQGRKYIQAIAYSIDRNQIVTGSCNNSGLNIARSPEVNLWNAQTGERILGPLMYLDMVFRVIRFSPDGIYISGIFDEYIVTVMWDVSNGGHTMNSHKSYSDKYTASICYSPDGALLASSGQGIFLVDAYTGAKILGPLVGHSHTVYLSVNFSPDGTRLASGAAHGTIQVWNVRTGEMIFDLLQGHEGHIRSIAYSPDGSRILSRSDDMTVRIHDARIPEERALSQTTAEYADWTMRPDGWVTDDQSRLLVWVPVDLRRALMWPRTQVLVGPCGYVRLSFNKSRMGESWEKSYTSRL